MTVAVEDVPKWVTWGGISHVVEEIIRGWTYTLCDTMTNQEPDEHPPRRLRVCRKCRKRLEAATLITEAME